MTEQVASKEGHSNKGGDAPSNCAETEVKLVSYNDSKKTISFSALVRHGYFSITRVHHHLNGIRFLCASNVKALHNPYRNIALL